MSIEKELTELCTACHNVGYLEAMCDGAGVTEEIADDVVQYMTQQFNRKWFPKEVADEQQTEGE